MQNFTTPTTAAKLSGACRVSHSGDIERVLSQADSLGMTQPVMATPIGHGAYAGPLWLPMALQDVIKQGHHPSINPVLVVDCGDAVGLAHAVLMDNTALAANICFSQPIPAPAMASLCKLAATRKRHVYTLTDPVLDLDQLPEGKKNTALKEHLQCLCR